MTAKEAQAFVNAEADRIRSVREAFNIDAADNPNVTPFCDTRVSMECRHFAMTVLMAYVNNNR